MNLLLETEESTVILRGPELAGVIKQFWSEVNWGDLDYLLIDMPPGTGDIPLTIYQSIPVDGIVIVTSPQDLVRMIVMKAYNMAEQMNLSTGQVARFEKIENYWNQTETFEALQFYIDMNFDGLKDDVLSMIAGEKVPVNTGSFTNDMTTFRTEDDVLTLLIHLGYLGYDSNEKCVFIPNNEIRSEYVNAVSVSDW